MAAMLELLLLAAVVVLIVAALKQRWQRDALQRQLDAATEGNCSACSRPARVWHRPAW